MAEGITGTPSPGGSGRSPGQGRGQRVGEPDGPGGGSAGRGGSSARGQGGRAGGGRGSPGRAKGRPGAGRGPSGPLWPVYRRLLGYMRPHLWQLAAVVAAVLATTAIELLPPVLIRYGIDHVIPGGRAAELAYMGAGLVGVALVQGGIDFARLYANAAVGHRIVFDVRNALFGHLSEMSFSFYDRARTGDLMSRVTADVDVLSEFFGRAAVIVLTNVLTLVGILAILLAWDWQLGLLYLLFLPAIVHGMMIYARRVRPAMMAVRTRVADLTSTLQEGLVGVLVVKLFGREDHEAVRLDRANAALRDANVEATRITSRWMPYVNVLMGAATAAVLLFGGLGVIQGRFSVGTLIGFMAYVGMLMRPIRQTGMMLNVFMRTGAAAERIFEVLDMQPEVRDAPDAYPLGTVAGRVALDDVHFAYDGGPEVLCGVSLEAEPGEMVALVGPSGSGKTTLAHLIPRFYDVQEGSVTIDGHDVRRVTLRSLREAVGIAMQSLFLFDASIGENIAYGRPGATRDEIEQVARAVQLHEFVTRLPMGYDTPVGERGVRLSGGQRQRLALARVLLRDARVLILDEPTSSVDTDTERRLQQALDDARHGRTTFVIAHRLWTVQRSDQIVLLDQGHIVGHARAEGGRTAHEILLERSERYRALYELQFRGEAMGDREAVR